MYRYWDRWLTSGEIPHLCHIDLESGEVTDLTPDEVAWWTWDNTGQPGEMFDISPDGRTAVFSAIPYPLQDAPVSAVFTVPVSGGHPTEISAGHHADCVRPRYSPDGSTIVYGRQERTDFYADRTRLVSHSVDSGEATYLPSTGTRPHKDGSFRHRPGRVRGRTRCGYRGTHHGVVRPQPRLRRFRWLGEG